MYGVEHYLASTTKILITEKLVCRRCLCNWHVGSQWTVVNLRRFYQIYFLIVRKRFAIGYISLLAGPRAGSARHCVFKALFTGRRVKHKHICDMYGSILHWSIFDAKIVLFRLSQCKRKEFDKRVTIENVFYYLLVNRPDLTRF